jgi:hypothetical protein
MNLLKYNLKSNPFQFVTPTQGSDLVWAGMPSVKKQLMDIYTQAYQQESKKLVLNWGAWGGGKTYAAFYFAKNRIGVPDENLLHIYIQAPKTGEAAVQELVRSIITKVGSNQWYSMVQEAITKVGQEEFKRIITERTDEIIADTIVRLFTGVFSMEIVNQYITRGLTNPKLDKMHLSSNLKSEQNFIDFLSGLLVAITIGNEKRVFIWIDEMEEMSLFAGKQFRLFNLMLRDLTDKVNERIIVFMNFTFSETDMNSLRTMFSDALWSRITDRIRYSDLDIEDAKMYCKDLLKDALIDASKSSAITDDLIEQILSLLPPSMLIPREINKLFSKIITYAVNTNAEQIDKEVINAALATI